MNANRIVIYQNVLSKEAETFISKFSSIKEAVLNVKDSDFRGILHEWVSYFCNPILPDYEPSCVDESICSDEHREKITNEDSILWD